MYVYIYTHVNILHRTCIKVNIYIYAGIYSCIHRERDTERDSEIYLSIGDMCIQYDNAYAYIYIYSNTYTRVYI